MAEIKNFPSLPPNYVSILHLQANQEAKKQRQKQDEEDRRKQARLEAEAEAKRIEQEQDDRNSKATCEPPDSKPYTMRSFRNRRRSVYNRRKIELSRTNPDEVEKIGAESEVIAGTVYNRRKIEAIRTNPDEVEETRADSDVIAGSLYNPDRAERMRAESDVIAGTVNNRRKASEEQARLEAEAEGKRIEQEQDDRNNKATCEPPDSKPYTMRSFRNRRRRVYNRRKIELSRTNPDEVDTIGAESEVIAGTVYNRRKIEAIRTNPDEVEETRADSDVIAGSLYNPDRAERMRAESDVIAGTVYNRRKVEAGHTSPDAVEKTGAECGVIIVDEIATVVQDGEGTRVDSMKKKKKNKKKGKPKKVEIVIGEVKHVKEVAVNENIPARSKGEQTVCLPKMEDVSEKVGDFSVARRNVKGRERTKLGFEKNGRKNMDSGQVWKIKEQIGEKLRDFSVNRRECKGREKTRVGFDSGKFCGGGDGKNVDFRRFYGDGSNGRDGTQRHGNFVWVKKDEVSDGNVASIS